MIFEKEILKKGLERFTSVLPNYAEGVYIINAKHCISSTRSIVYHQHEVLYLIIAKAEYSLRLMRYTLRVMICACGDDIPLLSQWIKKRQAKGRFS